jgi:hypothetical protein
LAGCAGLDSHYIPALRRAHLRQHKAEGQVGFTRLLGWRFKIIIAILNSHDQSMISFSSFGYRLWMQVTNL